MCSGINVHMHLDMRGVTVIYMCIYICTSIYEKFQSYILYEQHVLAKISYDGRSAHCCEGCECNLYTRGNAYSIVVVKFTFD